MIRVGPYRFSETDVRRTLRHATDLLDLMAIDRDPAALLPLKDAVHHALADIDPAAADADQLGAALPLVWAALLAAGPALRAAGQLPPRTEGRVVQVNTSAGGVPKHPVAFLDVDHGGPAGDVQRTRQHHGSPFQALCLWSEEVIDSFRENGHPLFPGAAGENITVSGLPWHEVRPGVRLEVGSVQCEVLAFAIPCAKNAPWFADGDFRQIHHDRGPVSRVYAAVVRPGRVEPGDLAILEP